MAELIGILAVRRLGGGGLRHGDQLTLGHGAPLEDIAVGVKESVGIHIRVLGVQCQVGGNDLGGGGDLLTALLLGEPADEGVARLGGSGQLAVNDITQRDGLGLAAVPRTAVGIEGDGEGLVVVGLTAVAADGEAGLGQLKALAVGHRCQREGVVTGGQ